MTQETEALAVIEPNQSLRTWTPRFALTVDEAVDLVNKKREFMKRVMREGEHFGTIPGTPKPTLYKPGAELLLSAMGLHSDSSINTVPPVIDLLGTEHGGEAFVQFQKTCEIYREEIAGERILIARASGNCSSWEKKYRYRKADRTCPTCNKTGTVIKGKAEYGGGWLCWKNKGGCGAKFTDTDKRITDQAAGDVPNPDIADLANTVEKIAAKRALVAATLLATGCSDIFTQDMEDGQADSDDDRAPAVDPDGEIDKAQASPETLAALKQAENKGASETAPGGARPASAEVKSGAVDGATAAAPKTSGPRAKRGNVVAAPQAVQTPKAEPSTPPVAVAPVTSLDEPLDGKDEYLASLRLGVRQAAAQLASLRVKLKNHQNKAEIALGNMQALPEVPETPTKDSDKALAAFLADQHAKDNIGAPTLDELTEDDLAQVNSVLDELIGRVTGALGR